MDKETNAKIGKKVVTISVIFVLGAGGANIAINNMKTDQPVTYTTILKEKVFGTRIALQSEINNLTKKGAENIEYHDSITIDGLPSGYLYKDGKGIKYIALNGDGQVPEGYQETTLNNEKVGYKTIDPTKINLGNSLTYDINENGYEKHVTLTYNQEKDKFETYTLYKNVPIDIITFCQKDNYLTDDFIYVPNYEDSERQAKPIRFKLEENSDNSTYIKDGEEYTKESLITFYTDELEPNDLINKYSGHLKDGEVMVLKSKKDGLTVFDICKKNIKEKVR